MSENNPDRFGLSAARVHGAQRILRRRASRARIAAAAAESAGLLPFAASLRGKAKGYTEAADLLEALERRRRLPARTGEERRWRDAPEGSADA